MRCTKHTTDFKKQLLEKVVDESYLSMSFTIAAWALCGLLLQQLNFKLFGFPYLVRIKSLTFFPLIIGEVRWCFTATLDPQPFWACWVS